MQRGGGARGDAGDAAAVANAQGQTPGCELMDAQTALLVGMALGAALLLAGVWVGRRTQR